MHNDLLMHTSGVAVTLEECNELAPEEGFADGWTAAAHYASHMLPRIFRPEDPVMQVRFATEDRLALEAILDGLDAAVFTADDALGWVYQFWQSEAKERINKSGAKIDGERLPAVTQLFTEPYMVHFLIDNTLGAWWTARHPGSQPPVPFRYLRLKEDGSPAAGDFSGWPRTLAELTCLDPCMGSGHFIGALFSTLAPLRMAEEGLTRDEAADAVIRDNLHGLELDPRCTQIAAFNLALTAWKWCGRYRALPSMNLACSGVAPVGKVEDWVKLVESAVPPEYRATLENGMRNLYRLFQQAPELGSLLDPSSVAVSLGSAHFSDLQPYLEKALTSMAEEEAHERGVVAAGIALAGALLSKKYVLQITNVPYLGRGKMASALANFCEERYPDAKADLATVFLDKMLKSTTPGGTTCSVIPQNWLFLTTYKKFREKLLKKEAWNFVVRLGPGAFSQISGEVVKAALVTISHKHVGNEWSFISLDVSAVPQAADKDAALVVAETVELGQAVQLNNPDARILTTKVGSEAFRERLEDYAKAFQGIKTGDDFRFKLFFWEVADFKGWRLTIGGPEGGSNFGSHYILNWKNQGKDFARLQGQKAFGERGFFITNVGKIQAAIGSRSVFTSEVTALIPNESIHSSGIYEYVTSEGYVRALRELDSNLAVSTSSLSKVPFDRAHWQAVAAEKYPDGLPQPYSDDPTQWLFHGHPVPSAAPLQVALARLAGYRWPAERDKEMELAPEARDLIARIAAHDALADTDGILPIAATAGEDALATRLRAYMQAVWGEDWSDDTLEAALTAEGATARSLDAWLRDEAFAQHCKIFGHRPFLWHIWDGRKDGFAAIVNYHKLDTAALRKLIYTYLGDHIRTCEAQKARGESGAEGRLIAAQELKRKLELILEGEKGYDIFVRWKALHEQPTGWEPDLNDGVRLNIRPFMVADVLRKKPNIKWGVDRGKNPAGAPWGEVRDNDVNLALAEKAAARAEVKSVTPTKTAIVSQAAKASLISTQPMIAFDLHEGIYSATDASYITGYTVPQITTWFTELVKKGYEGISTKKGDERRISFHGVIELKVIGALRTAGVDLGKILNARTQLRKMIEKRDGVSKEYPLATVHIKGNLWASGNNVIWKFPDDSLMNLDGTAQLNFTFINLFFDDVHFNIAGDADYLLPKSGDDRVELNPKSGGKPVIKDTIVPVAAIVANHHKGVSHAQICKQLGVLEVDINGALKYAKEYPWNFTSTGTTQQI